MLQESIYAIGYTGEGFADTQGKGSQEKLQGGDKTSPITQYDLVSDKSIVVVRNE